MCMPLSVSSLLVRSLLLLLCSVYLMIYYIVFAMKSNWSNYGIRIRGLHCSCCCCRRFCHYCPNRYSVDAGFRSIFSHWWWFLIQKWMKKKSKRKTRISTLLKNRVSLFFFCFGSYTQCHWIKWKKRYLKSWQKLQWPCVFRIFVGVLFFFLRLNHKSQSISSTHFVFTTCTRHQKLNTFWNCCKLRRFRLIVF